VLIRYADDMAPLARTELEARQAHRKTRMKRTRTKPHF